MSRIVVVGAGLGGMSAAYELRDTLGKGQRQIARTTRDVQHLVAFAHAAGGDGVGLPQAVQTHRHQVVHDVVLVGNGVKHTANALCLLGLVNLLETEVRAAHVGILLPG